MHNAVYPLSQELLDIPRPEHPKEKGAGKHCPTHIACGGKHQEHSADRA